MHVLGSGTRLNHGDLVGVADGGEAVRDDDGGAARGKALQRALHEALADSVQGAGGLVQQQQAGVLEQCSCNCNALLLPAAELHALLAHLQQDRVVDVAPAPQDCSDKGRPEHTLTEPPRMR